MAELIAGIATLILTFLVMKFMDFLVTYQTNYVRKLVGFRKYREFKKQGEDSLFAAYLYIINLYPELTEEYRFYRNLTSEERELDTQNKIILVASRGMDFDSLNCLAEISFNRKEQLKNNKKLEKLP